MSEEEATVNADGTTTFESSAEDAEVPPADDPPVPVDTDYEPPPMGGDGADFDDAAGAGADFDDAGGGGEEGFDMPPPDFEDAAEEVAKGIDPAVYLIVAAVIAALLYYFFVLRKSNDDGEDDFFSILDGDKVNE